MTLKDRINGFVKLGLFLQQFSNSDYQKNESIAFNDIFYDGFLHQIKLAREHNGWFTKENLSQSFKNWSEALTQTQLEKWTNGYDFDNIVSKKVAIIMAGNIPLVGFHDFLSALICNHQVVIKQSSNDKHLLPYLAKYLEYVVPEFKGRITFVKEKLEDFEAVIATGSNNTARYFEYYFKDKQSIIRKNRNSVAVLTGNETTAQLEALSDDIFTYFGLGCRNVSKVFIPEDYNFDAFFNGMYNKHNIIDNAKYANNYDYNKAVYLMSLFDILDNGFLMIKEDEKYASPIASVFYEKYTSLDELKHKLTQEKDNIQCIVSQGFTENEIDFGQTQHPKLWDYADGVNTLEFLLNLS